MLNNRGKEFDLLKLWNDQSVDDNLIKFILELSAAMFSMLSIIAEESQKRYYLVVSHLEHMMKLKDEVFIVIIV